MMREIKFRAWDGEEMRLLYWLNQHGMMMTSDYYSTPRTDMKPFKVMQFTGLLDREGVEIYEGDVIEFGDKHKEKLIVEWGVSCGCCSTVYGFVFHDHYDADESKVIGNIHQNSELLEVK